MQLDRTSFFMVAFLGIHPYQRGVPRTICELGRAALWRSLVWLFRLALFLLGATMFLTGTFLMLKAAFTDFTIATLFPQNGTGFLSLCVIAAAVVYIVVLAATVVILCTLAWEKIQEVDPLGKLIDVVYEFTNKPREPSKNWQFISGLYQRFKDKTCVIIQYTNEDRS